MTKSLWPDEINVIKEVPPISILKEQAALLGEKTQNLVIAEVESKATFVDFYDLFYLVAPVLNNYKFELFRVRRSVDKFYPLKVDSSALEMTGEKIVLVNSEEELLKTLANIFSHPKTVSIIQSMLIQSGWVPEGGILITY